MSDSSSNPPDARSHPVRARPGRVRSATIQLFSSYASGVITIAKGVLLVPLYLRLFGLEIYGAFLATANVIGLLGVLDLGIGAVLSQRLAETWGALDRERFARLVGAGLAIALGLSTTMLVAGVCLAPWVPALVNAPIGSATTLSITFVLTVIASSINLVWSNLLSIAAAWQHSGTVAISRLVAQSLDLLTVVLALFLGFGVVALGIGALCGSLLGSIVAVSVVARDWRSFHLSRPRILRKDLIDLGQTSIPMVLSRVALQIGSNLEVALVSVLVSPASAAIYALTDRVLRVGMSFINPVPGSALSGLAHYVGERGPSAATQPARELFSIWSLLVAALLPSLLALNQDFTALWVGSENFGGYALNVAMCGAMILSAREFLAFVVLTASGGLRAASLAQVAEVIFRLPLMFAALWLLGPLGLPVSSLVTSTVFLVVFARLVGQRLSLSRTECIAFNLRGALSISVLFLLSLTEALLLPRVFTWPGMLVKGILVGLSNLALAAALNPTGRAAVLRRFIRRHQPA